MTKKEALKKAGYVPKIGRPTMDGVMLSGLKIPEILLQKLQKYAKKHCSTLPDVRRTAYWLLVNMDEEGKI